MSVSELTHQRNTFFLQFLDCLARAYNRGLKGSFAPSFRSPQPTSALIDQLELSMKTKISFALLALMASFSATAGAQDLPRAAHGASAYSLAAPGSVKGQGFGLQNDKGQNAFSSGAVVLGDPSPAQVPANAASGISGVKPISAIEGIKAVGGVQPIEGY